MIPIPTPTLWSVLAALVVNFVLGGVLHGVVFSKVPIGKAKKIKIETVGFIGSILANLLMNFSLGVVVLLFSASGFSEGMLVGLLVWVGLIGPLQLAVKYANDLSLKTYLVNSFCMLCSMVVAGGILAVL